MEHIELISESIQPYVELAKIHLNDARIYVNESCKDLEAWQIIFFTISATILLSALWEFLFQDESWWVRIKKCFFRNVKRLPIIRTLIQNEMKKTVSRIQGEFNKEGTPPFIQKLPEDGMSMEKIMGEIDKYKKLCVEGWKEGYCSGVVYSGEDHLTELCAKVYSEFAWTNPLHPDLFPDIRKMEAEVVRMTCSMFNGGKESCGCMTGGGSESILLACKAYRDRAYEKGIKNPTMLIPLTAHAAFDKAAHYFRIRPIHIPIDEKTRRVNVKAMKKAITGDTCMMIGSAPAFPHGVLDPIKEIAELGVKYGIPVHVDCCLGGFLVPFMRKCGFDIPMIDFRVPGVTSISADTHKYGFAPKGSSVIMYCNEEYRKYQYFSQPDWPGGIYASPTMAGSRAGAIIAACWATLVHIGEKGYLKSTKKIINTAKYIEEGLREIPGIFVFGKPDVSVIGIGSDKFDIFCLSDALLKRGWRLNPLQFPSSVHLCCTIPHTKPGVADKFLKDARECAAEIMKNPSEKPTGSGAMYGMAQRIPDRMIVSDITSCFFDAYYNTTPVASHMSNGTSK